MSLSKIASNLNVSFFNKASYKNKKTALHNLKKPEIQKVLLEFSPEFDIFLDRVANQIQKVVIANQTLAEEPPKSQKKVFEEEEPEEEPEPEEEEPPQKISNMKATKSLPRPVPQVSLKKHAGYYD
jgi:hypothetical protein